MVEESDPRDRERVGTVLDEKWTLERILGSGGMGSVYAARHRNGARAAVKVLHPELSRLPDIRDRFLREGYAANRVEHRGAVRVLDDDVVKDGEDEGTAYLVMEILEGESLEDRIGRGPPLTEPELLTILADVLAVLESAHAHGVIHRDLKPANLFLNRDPAGPGVKVLDFGLARLEESRSVTGVGLALGTPSFMAPEQANGRSSEVDARSDIFAVGATAFMVVTGRGVHQADGVLELVARMGTLPAPTLRSVAPNVSETLACIVDRALAFKREDRYASAATMLADVHAALDGFRSVPSVVTSTHSEDSGALGAVPEARASNRFRLRGVAPALSALFVAAGLSFVFVPGLFEERASVPPVHTLGELVWPAPGTSAPMGVERATASSAVQVAEDDIRGREPSVEASSVASADVVSTTGTSSERGDAGVEEDEDEEEFEFDASDATSPFGRDASSSPASAHAGTLRHAPAKPLPGRRSRPPGKRRRRRPR